MDSLITIINTIFGIGLVVAILGGFLSMFFPSNEAPSRYRGAGTLREDADNE